jgi:SAM-dependent methyltransferase
VQGVGAVPSDYDENPGRFRLARSVLERHARAPDIHARVAQRLREEGLTPVLDVGCGDGELANHLPEGSWVGVDRSREMLARAPQPSVQADATALPFADGSFASLALLYVLYHVAEPRAALLEARRVLRPGGLLAVAVPSRTDSPELAHVLPQARLTFDAESAPQLVADVFAAVEVERWDAALLDLPTKADVRDYLIGKRVDPERAARAAAATDIPLAITKRGALLWARAPVVTGARAPSAR